MAEEGQHRFGRPLDPSILEEPAEEGRPLPLRGLALLVIPLAGLSLASALQWSFEGSRPLGDATLRWALLGSAVGLLLGALAGLRFATAATGRLLWALFGAASPALLLLLVVGGTHAVRPARDWLARRGEARCRTTRKVCTVGEFRGACTELGSGAAARARGLERLGAPRHERCDATGCTDRWLYTGPWTPDNWVAPGAILCSVVTGPDGAGQRSALNAGTEPADGD